MVLAESSDFPVWDFANGGNMLNFVAELHHDFRVSIDHTTTLRELSATYD